MAKLARIKPKISSIKTTIAAQPAVKRVRGSAGMKAREAILKRDGYLCQMCLPERAVLADEVDHIVPLCLGGGDNMENKQSLCKACHVAKSAEENKQRGV